MTKTTDMSEYSPEFFLYHQYGPRLRATFSSANDAHTWQRGNAGQPYADLFYFENVKGERVTFKDQPRHPGHAYTIMEAVAKAK